MPDAIPKGLYCYVPRKRRDDEPELTEDGRFYIETCPHWTSKEFGGVKMPWCSYLNRGGWDNREYSEEELKAIGGAFGSEQEQEETLGLFLLWGACKECGENLEEDDDKELLLELADRMIKDTEEQIQRLK